VEKKQSDICRQVLRSLRDNGVLDGLVLVGSWCVVLYEGFFRGKAMLTPIRTRDIEFLVPKPPRFKQSVNLYRILEDMGFVVDRKGEAGFMIFQHPDLILEFLAPDRGKGSDAPCQVPQLGINAQALRFMDLLAKNTITLNFGGVDVRAPHPANFALHKLLIARKRRDKEKGARDRTQAIEVLKALQFVDGFDAAQREYVSLPATWQKIIRQELVKLEEMGLIGSLDGSEDDR
jgi:hypothetical protein